MLSDLERLIQLMSRLPGLGPRSARRAVLELMKKRDGLMLPLADALRETAQKIETCRTCGNLDLSEVCKICTDEERDQTAICVVEEVSDLWAMERTRAFRGRYHVLGGHLSAIDGITPRHLNIEPLIDRAGEPQVEEIIMALGATVEGQTTNHYLSELLETKDVKVSRLALGLPVGGEVNYLDEGTLTTALRARR